VGKCPLCKVKDEALAHMLIDYSYSMSIWKDVELFIGLRNVWGG
jgi:hypothetical protein